MSLQYESVAPTTSSDRTCALARVCNTTTQIETIPPTATSDRVCTQRGSTTTAIPVIETASSSGDSTTASVPWWLFLIAFLGLLIIILVGAVYAQRRRRSDSYDVAVMPYTINQTNAAFSPVTSRNHAGSPTKLTTGGDESFDEPAGMMFMGNSGSPPGSNRGSLAFDEAGNPRNSMATADDFAEMLRGTVPLHDKSGSVRDVQVELLQEQLKHAAETFASLITNNKATSRAISDVRYPAFPYEMRFAAGSDPSPNENGVFWSRVWQDAMECVVQISGGPVGGCRYYPDTVGATEVFVGATGDVEYLVTLTRHDAYAGWEYRQLDVSVKGVTRAVHHLHFTSWPSSPADFVEFALEVVRVRAQCRDPAGKLSVHSGEGVGSSGSLILFMVMKDKIDNGLAPDSAAILEDLRKGKPGLCATSKHFAFAIECCLHYTRALAPPNFDGEM